MKKTGNPSSASRLQVWLRVSRANFLPTSLLPFCLGTALAFSRGFYNLPLSLAGLLGAGLVHLAANLFNEYWDYRYRADLPAGERSPHYGGSGAIQEGAVSPRAVLAAAWAGLTVALAGGAALSLALANFLVIVLAVLGGAIAWAYTAPPLRLIYRGGGEAALWLAFGPLLTGGGYLLPAGDLSGPVLLLSLGPGFMIAALLTANEFGDTAADARAGKRNLVVRAGAKRGLVLVGIFLSLSFLVPLLGAVAGTLPTLALLVLLGLPPAALVPVRLARGVGGEEGFAFSSRLMISVYNLYHFLLIAGLVIR